MAAGWDMLQALKALVKWYGNRTGVGDELSPVDEQEAEVAAAMRAIAKAEGRT